MRLFAKGRINKGEKIIEVVSNYDVKSLVISSIKGGVGKTGSTMCLAGAFAEMRPDWNVMIIDCDSQANTSIALGFNPAEHTDNCLLYDIFDDPKNITLEDCLWQTKIPNIYLAPADRGLYQKEAEIQLHGFSAIKETRTILRDKVNEFKMSAKKNWLIMFDTRPDLGIFTLNAYLASDRVIIPVTPDEFAFQGIKIVDKTITDIRNGGYNRDLRVLGIYRSLWEKANSHNTRLAEAELATFTGNAVFNTFIPNHVSVRNAMRERLPVNFHAKYKNTDVSNAFRSLMEEVMGRWNTRVDMTRGSEAGVQEMRRSLSS